jgi:hypothetical protein
VLLLVVIPQKRADMVVTLYGVTSMMGYTGAALQLQANKAELPLACWRFSTRTFCILAASATTLNQLAAFPVVSRLFQVTSHVLSAGLQFWLFGAILVFLYHKKVIASHMHRDANIGAVLSAQQRRMYMCTNVCMYVYG